MSKGPRHPFPTKVKTGDTPNWMQIKPQEVQPMVWQRAGGGPAHRPSDRPGSGYRAGKSIPPGSGEADSSGSIAPGRLSVTPEYILAKKDLEEQINAFSQAAMQLAAARAAALTFAEGQLLDLAIAIATVIVEKELEQNPELYRSLVQMAIRALGATEPVVLRASKDSFETILKVFGNEVIHIDGIEIRITLDLAIEGLGCVAESADRRVDATLVGRLRAIRRAFEDERRRATEAA
jgi:flagellar assembly protein FliH